jgi:uncharacterized protein (TIGR03435 family)
MRIWAFLLFAAIPAIAQAPPTDAPRFEVASIRPANSGGNYVETKPGTVLVHSATLATCIKWAYGVTSSQISGADLLDSERYEIVAKASEPVSDATLRVMFQNLLADRFKLALHRQSRETQVYALQVEKEKPKFHESEGEGESRQQLVGSKLHRQWKWTTIAGLTDSLSEAVQRPIIDRTGLTGRYDFDLDLTPYLAAGGDRPELGRLQQDLPGMVVTAVREQLGLKLTAMRASVDVLVIDHVETPSPN